MKVHILISVVNNPEFIGIQKRLFETFCRDEFEIVILNDAYSEPHYSNFFDGGTCAAIENECSGLGLTCYRVPQEIHSNRALLYKRPRTFSHDPATRTADTLDWGLRKIGLDVGGIIAVLDSDMFPIAPFSFKEKLGGSHLCGVPQMRARKIFGITLAEVHYIWNGIFYLDSDRLPNKDHFVLDAGKVRSVNCDVGCGLHDYFNKTPDLILRRIAWKSSGSWWYASEDGLPAPIVRFLCEDPRNQDKNHFAELYEETFLHYRAGGNWDRLATETGALRKTLLRNAMAELLLQS